jgi:hypothetical protein
MFWKYNSLFDSIIKDKDGLSINFKWNLHLSLAYKQLSIGLSTVYLYIIVEKINEAYLGQI